MIHIVLYEPEIPPNTGNIIRLCANTSSHLHLIKPLGFTMHDKQLRRAGLDYHEFSSVNEFEDLRGFIAKVHPERLYALSTKAKTAYHQVTYRENDALLFGPESRGLPADILETFKPEHKLRLPMAPGSRSLNLSNTVAIVLYEALRQNNFPHLD